MGNEQALQIVCEFLKAMVARKASATPATGFYALHLEEEKELIDRALAEVGALPVTGARRSPQRRRV